MHEAIKPPKPSLIPPFSIFLNWGMNEYFAKKTGEVVFHTTVKNLNPYMQLDELSGIALVEAVTEIGYVHTTLLFDDYEEKANDYYAKLLKHQLIRYKYPTVQFGYRDSRQITGQLDLRVFLDKTEYNFSFQEHANSNTDENPIDIVGNLIYANRVATLYVDDQYIDIDSKGNCCLEGTNSTNDPRLSNTFEEILDLTVNCLDEYVNLRKSDKHKHKIDVTYGIIS